MVRNLSGQNPRIIKLEKPGENCPSSYSPSLVTLKSFTKMDKFGSYNLDKLGTMLPGGVSNVAFRWALGHILPFKGDFVNESHLMILNLPSFGRFIQVLLYVHLRHHNNSITIILKPHFRWCITNPAFLTKRLLLKWQNSAFSEAHVVCPPPCCGNATPNRPARVAATSGHLEKGCRDGNGFVSK